MRTRTMTTFRTLPEPAGGRGFGQGRRRLRALWHHVASVAITLAIFAVLVAVTLALRFAIWLPLSHLA